MRTKEHLTGIIELALYNYNCENDTEININDISFSLHYHDEAISYNFIYKNGDKQIKYAFMILNENEYDFLNYFSYKLMLVFNSIKNSCYAETKEKLST